MLRGLVLIGCALAVACGGSSAAPNPSVAVSVSPSGVALAGATRVTFAGTAAGLREGPTYRWSFGDGTSATGPIVTHVFDHEGTFNVTVVAVDSRGDTSEAGVSLQVRSLAGRWTPYQNGVPGIEAALEQAGSTLSGRSTNDCCTHTFAGQVGDPRTVTLVFRFSGCPREPRTFVGTVSADLSSISLAGPNCNLPNTTFGFRR